MHAGVDKRRRLLKGPAGAALLVWAAWFLGAGLMWWQARAGALHPHFLPLLSLVLVQLLAAAAAVGLGLRRVVRGPRRLAAFCWVLVAVIPIMLWVVHASYTLACLHRATLPANVATRTALVAGAALADAEARWRYPRRLSGERVVMIYDRLADPDRDLGAMDRHVARLKGLLARPMRGKVHWVRGSLLGFHGGRGFQGIALCERGKHRGPDGLSELERHEVAHVVINQHLPPGAEPPTVLNEGWAESQEGAPPATLLSRARHWQRNERLPSLRELVGPEWYFRMRRPVYVYGGPLVDYLLREYGADKFFELYTTCRQETFEADCRRVLGVGLDGLEQQFWTDLGIQWEEQLALAEQSLPPLPDVLEPGPTGEAAREKFLSEYPEAAQRLEAGYAAVTIRAVKVYPLQDGADGEEEALDRREFDLAQSGDGARLVSRWQGHVVVWVANPNTSFHIVKPLEEEAFTVQVFSSGSTRGYRSMREQIRLSAQDLHAPYCLDGLPIPELMAEPGFKMRSVVGSDKDGKTLITVHFAKPGFDPDGDVFREAGWFSVCPDDAWAVYEYESRYDHADGKQVVRRADVQYGPKHKGIPALQAVRTRLLGPEDRELEITLDVESIDFGPVPEAEFELASFGVDSPEERRTKERVDVFSRVLRLTLWSLATVIVTLVLSVGLHLVRRPEGP